MNTSYDIRTLPATTYNITSRISGYYLIDEENNFITDEEGNYIIIVGEGSDGLPLSDYLKRTIPVTSYNLRPQI